MKAFRYIISILIFALSAVAGYQCIDTLSVVPYCFFGLTLLCGFLVLTDGLKDKNA